MKSIYSLLFKLGSSFLAYKSEYNNFKIAYIKVELIIISVELIKVIHWDVVIEF